MATELVPAGVALPLPRASEDALGSSRMLHQLLFVIFKRRRLILGTLAAFTVAAGIAMWLKPVTASATAKVLLKPDRIALQLANLVPEWSRLPHWPQMLQSEVELMDSPDVLRPVARTLLTRAAGAGATVGAAAVEAKANELGGNLVSLPVPDTNLIQMTYTAPKPEEALKVLRLVVDQYMDLHSRANSGAQDLLAFYRDEGNRVRHSLQAAEDDLEAWQEREGVVNIATQISDMLGSATERQKALRQTNADLEATAARIAQLERIRRAEPARRVTMQQQIRNPLLTKLEADVSAAEVAVKDIDKHPLVQKAHTDLQTAQVALGDLRQRYTDADRHVREKAEQVAFLQQQLDTTEHDVESSARARLEVLRKELAAAQRQAAITGSETSDRNLVRDELDKELTTARAQLASLGAQKTVLVQQIADLNQGLDGVRAKKVEDDRRQREVQARRDAFALYGKKLEEARIAAGLEKQQLASVALVQHPHIDPGTDLRRRILMIVLAAFVGLVLGMAGAFGLEFVGTSLRTAGDVEYYLGVPVLAAIPDAEHLALPAPRGTAAVRVS